LLPVVVAVVVGLAAAAVLVGCLPPAQPSQYKITQSLLVLGGLEM
tara:strand:+ start:167 stop:301 length:135 start_codon:yes stop_codon:yes gene_type:complete